MSARQQESIKKFKQRWAKINKFQDDELLKLSFNEKLCQLSSIIRLAKEMRLDFNEDQQRRKVRSRWVFLKKR